MNSETARKIRRMIDKECCRYNLAELCEDRGITVDDYDKYLDGADKQMPKIPKWDGIVGEYICPGECQEYIGGRREYQYCPTCGQFIDWENEVEND